MGRGVALGWAHEAEPEVHAGRVRLLVPHLPLGSTGTATPGACTAEAASVESLKLAQAIKSPC